MSIFWGWLSLLRFAGSILGPPILLLFSLGYIFWGVGEWNYGEARWELARELATRGVPIRADVRSAVPHADHSEAVVAVTVAYSVNGKQFSGTEQIPDALYRIEETVGIRYHPEKPGYFLIDGQQVGGRFLFKHVLFGVLLMITSVALGLLSLRHHLGDSTPY